MEEIKNLKAQKPDNSQFLENKQLRAKLEYCQKTVDENIKEISLKTETIKE